MSAMNIVPPIFGPPCIICDCECVLSATVNVCDRDRCHAPVNLNVVHGTIMSFVEMEKFKTKQSTKVANCCNIAIVGNRALISRQMMTAINRL